MKISCDKNRLYFAIQTVQKAVATKTPMPILTGIYITTKENTIQLQATDYEIGITCEIEANIYEKGNIIISGKYFQEIVRRLPGDLVNIEKNKTDKTIIITSGSAQYNFLNMPSEEFPIIMPIQTDNKLTIKDNVLKNLIKKSAFACATDEARPVFTGTLIETTDTEICFVATNTHRLALKKYIIDNKQKNMKIIVPAKILQELARSLVSDIPLDVEIKWNNNQVSFSYDGVYIVSRLIEGQYPDYNRVIPQNFTTEVQLETQTFYEAVERVALLSRDGDYNIIKFLFKNKSLTLSSNNPEIGKACEVIQAEIIGNELEVAFNAKYVIDILKNTDSEKINISLNTALSPGCIKPYDDETFIYIITPVRIN